MSRSNQAGQKAEEHDPARDPVARADPSIEFRPTKVDPARFARVAALVREVTAAAGPSTTSRQRDLLRCGTYLAGWCDAQGLPLRAEVVFAPDLIEEFLADLAGRVPPRSLATMASVLRTMSGASSRHASVGSARRHHRRRQARPPYSGTEVAALFDLADRSRSAKRRSHLAALLGLGLGAGATGQEAAWVRPADIVPTASGAEVRLRRTRVDGSWRTRTVIILAPYRALLCGLAEAAPGFLLGGGPSRHSRVYDLCDHSRAGRWPIPLEPARLRATYLAEIASQPNTALELLARGGVETFEVFDELVPHLRARGSGAG